MDNDALAGDGCSNQPGLPTEPAVYDPQPSLAAVLSSAKSRAAPVASRVRSQRKSATVESVKEQYREVKEKLRQYGDSEAFISKLYKEIYQEDLPSGALKCSNNRGNGVAGKGGP
jgi:hypothetical protein